MTEVTADRWSQWLGSRRDGADPESRAASLRALAPIRDRVLNAAGNITGATVLDVGCGEGLVGLAALDRVGETGKVVFSDISEALVTNLQSALNADGGDPRARFVVAGAEDLAPIADGVIDLVTARSVIVYLTDKAAAFRAIHRVLRPGGLLSMFEPINGMYYPEPDDRLDGYDVTPVKDLAARVKAARFDPTDPALKATFDFDERDLVRFATEAGFAKVLLNLEVGVGPGQVGASNFDAFLDSAHNPLTPTLRESIQRALSAEEATRFVAHLRAAFESPTPPLRHIALAYLVAQRG